MCPDGCAPARRELQAHPRPRTAAADRRPHQDAESDQGGQGSSPRHPGGPRRACRGSGVALGQGMASDRACRREVEFVDI